MASSPILRSLAYRNYRIWFFGQLISLNGTWMQSVAQGWLLYRLTDSGFMLGLAGTLALLPSLVFGLLGGALADHLPRRQVLIGVKVVATLQAFTLGMLTLEGWIQPWHILLLALFLGLVQAIETPIRQAFVADLVARDDLPNAIALNSGMFQTARFTGPVMAGLLVAWVGEGPVFLVNAVTFLAVIIGLYAIQLPARNFSWPFDVSSHQIFAGLQYARQQRLVWLILCMVASVSFFGGSATVLLPIFAKDVFGHGSESLGLLMGMLGVGALLGALALARLRRVEKLNGRVAGAGVLVAAGWLAFASLESYWLALIVLPLVGLGTTTVFASSNALLQLSVPDDLRGRVMALYAVALHGMVSLGQLVIGWLADTLGAQYAVALGAGMLLGVVAFSGSSLRNAPLVSSPREKTSEGS